MMNNVFFQRIANLLLLPFKQNFLFFLIFCILTASCPFMVYFNVKNEINLTATFVAVMHCISLSYFVTLLIGVIRHGIIRSITQTVFIIFGTIDFILNFYCTFYLHDFFSSDIALLLLETDPKEAKEFFASLVPIWMIITIICVFLFCFFLWRLIKRYDLNFHLGKKSSLFAMGIICIGIALSWYKRGIWEYGPIGPFYTLLQHENPSDLRIYFSHPQLTFINENEMPTNVVLIIGESFGRSHSSIYGYNKLTNPLLAQLKENSLLFSFDSINSPAHSTVQSLRYMLSTFDLSNEQDKKWYEFISIIELMKESGFASYWFGNQGRIGKHNGTTRVYAQACDQQWFLKDDHVEDQLDIVLVDSSYQFINHLRNKKHNFIIYHMKGSHFDYSLRYPKEFDQFSVNEYQNEPQNHRDILASYDNSILYNDFVVDKIMGMFKDTESIVIYVPDHGQVMYRDKNNPDYYAHGRKKDPISFALGIDIPFFVYASPLYQQKHPEMMERIKYRQDNPKTWNSDNLPYFIMDLIGVKEINGENIKSKSVLN